MQTEKMNKQEWKALLEPFAIVAAGMSECIIAMDDDNLLELRTACDQPTTTNCWCWTYRAANIIRGEVDGEIIHRGLTPNVKVNRDAD